MRCLMNIVFNESGELKSITKVRENRCSSCFPFSGVKVFTSELHNSKHFVLFVELFNLSKRQLFIPANNIEFNATKLFNIRK